MISEAISGLAACKRWGGLAVQCLALAASHVEHGVPAAVAAAAAGSFKALWANGQYEPAQLAFAAAHQKYTTVGLVAEAHRLAVDMAALGARPVPSERGNQAI